MNRRVPGFPSSDEKGQLVPDECYTLGFNSMMRRVSDFLLFLHPLCQMATVTTLKEGRKPGYKWHNKKRKEMRKSHNITIKKRKTGPVEEELIPEAILFHCHVNMVRKQKAKWILQRCLRLPWKRMEPQIPNTKDFTKITKSSWLSFFRG